MSITLKRCTHTGHINITDKVINKTSFCWAEKHNRVINIEKELFILHIKITHDSSVSEMEGLEVIGVYHHFQQLFSYIMTTSPNGIGKQ